MVQMTLDGKIAERALRRIRDVLMEGESETPKLYRNVFEPYFVAMRRIALDVVLEHFAVRAAPIPRDALINRVIEVIKGKRLKGEWPWPIPRWDTVRRRVNELLKADVMGYPPPALAVAAKIAGKWTTVYFPNPLRVHPSRRKRLLEVIKEWEDAKKGRR